MPIGHEFHRILFCVAIVVALILFFNSVIMRVRIIFSGQSNDWDINWISFFKNVFGHVKLFQDWRSGFLHLMFFYGFIILQIGALDIFLLGLFPNLKIDFFNYWLLEFSQEFMVLLITLAALGAFYRRYIERLVRLTRDFKSSWAIILLIQLMVSLLFFAWVKRYMLSEIDRWYLHAPISSFLVDLLPAISPGSQNLFFWIGWWWHALVLFCFLVYIPYSKHFHILIAPINVFLHRSRQGVLQTIPFEEGTSDYYGVKKISDFSRKQIIDLYACVECGRCTDVCPASSTGKFLSPMDLLVKLRDYATREFSSDKMGLNLSSHLPAKNLSPITDAVIMENELWACTTCGNCEQACPVANEHVDKIIDLRRYLTMTESKLPAGIVRVLNNIDRQGNLWGLPKVVRNEWFSKFSNVFLWDDLAEHQDIDILLFVGSMASYDQRSRRIVSSLAKLMDSAGMVVAVLGAKEGNSGDLPRRLGHEWLFQQLAKKNIDRFKSKFIRQIVTVDPHAYNIFKNEYTDLGLDINIMHHTEFLAQLLRQKKILPKYEVNISVVYHDSCYLGRYNGLYEDPRFILNSIPGLKFLEIDRNKQNSMCCGAGGGMMWLEDDKGPRVSDARTEQLLQKRPDVIGTACPYCLTMFEDSVKMKEESAQILDVVELLAQSVLSKNVCQDLGING